MTVYYWFIAEISPESVRPLSPIPLYLIIFILQTLAVPRVERTKKFKNLPRPATTSRMLNPLRTKLFIVFNLCSERVVFHIRALLQSIFLQVRVICFNTRLSFINLKGRV